MDVLNYDEIPFGHWGIINKENFRREILSQYKQHHSEEDAARASEFSLENLIQKIEEDKELETNAIEEALSKVPKKVWDFTFSENINLDSNGSKIVINDKYKGRFALISAIRADRPFGTDPLSEIIAGNDFAIVVAKGSTEYDSPFSILPKKENLSSEKAVTMINRYPAYLRVIDKDVDRFMKPKINNSLTKIARGINLITTISNYYEKIEDANIEEIATILESMKCALLYIRREAANRGISYIPEYPFFNIGKKVGGSLKRLHAQAYIDLNQDGHGSTMEDILQAFDNQRYANSCKFCNQSEEQIKKFFLYENEYWSAYATRAPIRNYDLKIVPKRHVEDMTMLTNEEFLGLGDALRKLSSALNTIGADPDRNVLLYQRPFGYNSYFHMFLQVLHFENVGGMEMMEESRVVRVDPADFAGKMRKIISSS
ncbi:MAG: hypothetical protein NTZ02_04035 [Candidatus Woesearchaeota archaeon]|nr:hypothetical protein [Candidatus Woesearchaeota archaeon]